LSFVANLKSEPWRFDFFTVLRQLERSSPDRPRIGDSAARREEVVEFAQDPFFEFPASNLLRVDERQDHRLKVFVKFLGMLGPQGALPVATTEEAFHYVLAQDDAFPRFLDIFNNRFIQLFFRAWADSRPIVQHDRPSADRFIAYIGSSIGIGSSPYSGLDSVPDGAKLTYAGLLGAQARSPYRLAAAISGLFGIRAEIDEFVGTWLQLDPSDVSSVGGRLSRLGQDLVLGSSVFSVQDKFRVRIFTVSLEQYMRFLPSGDLCEKLADLVFFYNGEQLDWEVELLIPAGLAAPATLGKFGQLGWTGWMAPNWTSDDEYRRDTRFHPAERVKQRRRDSNRANDPDGGRDGGHQS
jgi:type VI secretion system protein ImpH